MAKLMAAEPERSAIIVQPHAAGMTPEEHGRRGNVADALFREIKRRVADSGI